jgi:hypothetical protein
MKKKILYVLLFIFIGIQFIQPKANKGQAATNQDISHYVEVPGHIQNILKASCYDCHSNHTNYPWYASINPLGLWLDHHIREGKEELNFSDFSRYDKKKLDHKLEETLEEVQEGHMPLPAYLWLHDEAKLNQHQINQVVAWVKNERRKLAVAK